MGGASIDVHGVPLTDEAIATAKSGRRGSDGFHRRQMQQHLPLVQAPSGQSVRRQVC